MASATSAGVARLGEPPQAARPLSLDLRFVLAVWRGFCASGAAWTSPLDARQEISEALGAGPEAPGELHRASEGRLGHRAHPTGGPPNRTIAFGERRGLHVPVVRPEHSPNAMVGFRGVPGSPGDPLFWITF